MSYNPNFDITGRNVSRQIPTRRAWTVRRKSAPRPAQPLSARITRRFDVEWFDGTGIQDFSRVVPALPLFEEAFGAFAHGIVIQTDRGPVAIEDIEPGMMLETGDGDFVRLMWKGSINLIPGAPTLSDVPQKIYRMMPDALGPGKPVQDQSFGPHARRLDRDPKARALLGVEQALLPLRLLADGMSVIEVQPVAPVRIYHLATERHAAILAGGVEVETYHPGPDFALSMSDEMMDVFMNFFPYLDDIPDFGRMCAARLSEDDLAAMG